MPLASLNFVNKHYVDLAITLLITNSPQEKKKILIMTELIICSLNIFLV